MPLKRLSMFTWFFGNLWVHEHTKKDSLTHTDLQSCNRISVPKVNQSPRRKPTPFATKKFRAMKHVRSAPSQSINRKKSILSKKYRSKTRHWQQRSNMFTNKWARIPLIKRRCITRSSWWTNFLPFLGNLDPLSTPLVPFVYSPTVFYLAPPPFLLSKPRKCIGWCNWN